MNAKNREARIILHWLDYDPVAVAVLVIGIAMIELLARSFDSHRRVSADQIHPENPWTSRNIRDAPQD
jgi:hypothetical protein